MKINDSMPINIDQLALQKENVGTEEFQTILEKARESKDEKKLLDSCRQFEALFLQTIMKTSRPNISNDTFIQKSHGREIFEGMYDEKLSEEMTKGQGIGLAQQLYKQLSKQINVSNK